MTGDPMVDILLALLLVVAFAALVHWGRTLRGGVASRRSDHAVPQAPSHWVAEASQADRHEALMWRLELSLLPAEQALSVLTGPPGTPEADAQPTVHRQLGSLALALLHACRESGLIGPQLHVAGGNLVTKPAYGMDPLTGLWGLNAFPDRTPVARPT